MLGTSGIPTGVPFKSVMVPVEPAVSPEKMPVAPDPTVTALDPPKLNEVFVIVAETDITTVSARACGLVAQQTVIRITIRKRVLYEMTLLSTPVNGIGVETKRQFCFTSGSSGLKFTEMEISNSAN